MVHNLAPAGIIKPIHVSWIRVEQKEIVRGRNGARRLQVSQRVGEFALFPVLAGEGIAAIALGAVGAASNGRQGGAAKHPPLLEGRQFSRKRAGDGESQPVAMSILSPDSAAPAPRATRVRPRRTDFGFMEVEIGNSDRKFDFTHRMSVIEEKNVSMRLGVG